MKEGVIKDEERRRRKKESQLLQGMTSDLSSNPTESPNPKLGSNSTG